MIRHAHPRARRYGRPQHGAALVELALVAMLIITLIAGTYDLGQGWRAGLATNESVRTAARTGSAMGSNPLADWYALSGARAALQNSNMLNNVDRVVVYKSSTADGNIPTACKTVTSTTEKCNIFTGAQFRAMNQAGFNTTTGCYGTATVKNWCPSSRNNVQLTADYYGVWIQVKQPKQFKFLGQFNNVTRDAAMRLEPTET